MARAPLFRSTVFTCVILLIAVPLVTYATFIGRSTRSPQSMDDEITIIPSALTLADELEVELITLRPAGFEPSEVTRPKGAFVLFINDRSGKNNSSLVLQRASSERLRTIGLQRKKSEWNDVVDLSPGTYVLQDANNPELRCQITILP